MTESGKQNILGIIAVLILIFGGSIAELGIWGWF